MPNFTGNNHASKTLEQLTIELLSQPFGVKEAIVLSSTKEGKN